MIEEVVAYQEFCILEMLQVTVDGTVEELVMVKANTDTDDWKQEIVTPVVALVQMKPELSRIKEGKVIMILSPEW